MKHEEKRNRISQELEDVFRECQEHINKAVRSYQKDIHSAIDDLKQDLTLPKIVAN